ncbi:MAG: hypothetical protein JSS02_09090 [Planctomycetes bacterium]|nr:hypothetical protein [Planctomycetota bacterium]
MSLGTGVVGCSSSKQSNTARTATEQLLISNAVDQSLNKIDFTPLAGANVFVEEKYVDCIDKGYVIGSVRHKLLQAGAALATKIEDADCVMELRSGSVGTDVNSSYIGVPGFTAPGMIGIPDIKLITHDSQKAIAKIGIVVYDAKSRRQLGEGGVSLSRADDTNSFYFGVGPKQSGTLQYEIMNSVGTKPGQHVQEIPTVVAISEPQKSAADPGKIQLSGGEKEAEKPAK